MIVEDAENFWSPIRLKRLKNKNWKAWIGNFTFAQSGETEEEALFNLSCTLSYTIISYVKKLRELKKIELLREEKRKGITLHNL